VPHEDLPPDPFADDPHDPAQSLDGPVDHDEPISEAEREELIADIAALDLYQSLLQPKGLRGIVVDCADCDEPHYHDWDLLRSSLRQLLDNGRMRPHEPAFSPNPLEYVSWEYCRGYADAARESHNIR
jgi:hypothetical protein